MSLIKLKAKGRPDNFQTPSWPVEMLIDKLRNPQRHLFIENPVDGWVWDPCCGEGQILKTLHKMGVSEFGTDLEPVDEDFNQMDFLKDEPDFEFDCIITNPPYSIKDDFIERCYELQKPWAMLMPLSALEGKKRQALYKKHGMELLILPRRVDFKTPSGKGSGAHFATAWFTHGFHIGKEMTFL